MVDSAYTALPAAALAMCVFLGFDPRIFWRGTPISVFCLLIVVAGFLHPPLTGASWWATLPFLAMVVVLVWIQWARGRPAPKD